MTHDECNTSLNLVADYFPRLGERISKSPGLAKYAHQALLARTFTDFERAILRYATTHNADPTWEHLMEMVERVEEERSKAAAWARNTDFDVPEAVQSIYEQAVPRMSSEADIAWAKMHVQFVLRGIAQDHQAGTQIACYEQLMQQYPELEADCLRQIRRMQHAPLAPQPVGGDDDDDMPF